MITVFGSQPRIPPPSTFARIEDWKGQGPALGRAEAARRLEEAHKLLEELGNMLVDVRRELLGRPAWWFLRLRRPGREGGAPVAGRCAGSC
jgi:hypothetical protein